MTRGFGFDRQISCRMKTRYLSAAYLEVTNSCLHSTRTLWQWYPDLSPVNAPNSSPHTQSVHEFLLTPC